MAFRLMFKEWATIVIIWRFDSGTDYVPRREVDADAQEDKEVLVIPIAR